MSLASLIHLGFRISSCSCLEVECASVALAIDVADPAPRDRIVPLSI